MSEPQPAPADDRMRAALEGARASADAAERRTRLARALLDFGAGFVVFVEGAWAADREGLDSLRDDFFELWKGWLGGKRLGDQSDEDARRVAFAFWLLEKAPELARLAASAVMKLPEGHPERDVDRVRAALLAQFQAAIEGRADTPLVLDAIAGLLQLELLSEERSLEMISAGRRILERKDLLDQDDNFRTVAVPCLIVFAAAAERAGDAETEELLRAEADALTATLDAIAEPSRDTLLIKAVMGTRRGKAAAGQLRRSLFRAGERPDEMGLFAARVEGRVLHKTRDFAGAIEVLTPIVPMLEERYLTALEPSVLKQTGADLSETLVRLAFCHAQSGAWNDVLRLADRGKSLRARYERVVREVPGAERMVELQAAIQADRRGLSSGVSLPGVDAAADPVGARLSMHSRLLEEYRRQRAALAPRGLDGAGVPEVASWLRDDEAAVLLAECDGDLLIGVVTSDDDTEPTRALVLPAAMRAASKPFVDPGFGWLVALASPEMVERPEASLDELLATLDEVLGKEIAALVADLGVRRLFVVAHHFLHLAPFWALPSLSGYLVEMLPSAAHIGGLRGELVRLGGKALVVGNPTLDLPTAEVESALVADALRGAGFVPLLLRGAQATEEALNRQVAGATLLHFAGHGRSDLFRPLESALEVHPVLGEPPPGGADLLTTLAATAAWGPSKDNERWADIPGRGRLYERVFPVTRGMELRLEYEVRGTLLGQYSDADGDGARIALRLSELWSAGDLVTGRTLAACGLACLSSCESGQGALTVGLDESEGLPAAFELAGVKTLVCPMWRVDDVTSAVFARLFYAALLSSEGEIDAGELVAGVRHALRDMPAGDASRHVLDLAARAERPAVRFRLEALAQRIADEGVAPFAHPFDWAAFHVVGSRRMTLGAPEPGRGDTGDATAARSGDRVRRRAVRHEVRVESVETPPEPPAALKQDRADLFATVGRMTREPVLCQEAAALLLARARRRIKRGAWDGAEADLLAVVELVPAHAEAHAVLATVALGRGDLAAALDAAGRALDIEPNLALAHRERGTALFASQEIGPAIASYATALRLDDSDHETYLLRGTAHLATDRLLDAFADMISAIYHAPAEPRAYALRAAVLLRLQRAPQALRDCETAIKLKPDDGSLYLQRAVVYAALADVEATLRDCDAAILLLADPAPAFATKGYFLAAAGNLADALAELARGIEAAPAFWNTYYNRACAYSMHEQAGTIVADLQRAIELVPQTRAAAAVEPALAWARERLDGVHELLGTVEAS